ncbi:hypothetical protein CLOM_g3064 [Closterium sp. NIES-68]|nr:hypothetical protein CLOM_g3064 [Closterium sp. NIES-68]
MGNDAETTAASSAAAEEEKKPTDAAPADAAPAVDAAAAEGEEKKEEGEGAEKKEGEGEAEGEGDSAAKKDAEELQLYPLAVKGPAGEEIELQVNPADTVMDLKQFLADAPETCFYTAYDLILTKPDGLRYHLMDYVEIGEVADVAAGGCLLEMFNTFYDDRAVRLHVRKTRELISMAGSYSSASTAMAAEYELVKGLATERELGEGRKSKEEEAKERERREKEKEKERKAKLPSSKARMEEIASLEQGVGLGDDPKGVLAKVMVKGGGDEEAAPVCVESIAFSSFNPVPGPRRLQGDLIYLEVVTAEGKLFCVTAHTRGFFVNRSGSGRKLDPRPADPKVEASTLIGLLRQLSPLFSKAFAEVIERKANRHPFENMLAPLPPNDWAAKPIWGGADGTGPLQYTRDVARSEDALMAPFGIDFSGVLRDWNEELQSCRELPRNSLQDRILRDRALYRVSCEFADSAVRGAKAVIGRSIPPINPHDADRFHMYVHNNIFFSLAVDGDFAALQQIREAELKQQAEAEAEKKGEEGGEKKEGGEEGAKEEGKTEAKEEEKKEEKKEETKEEKKERRKKDKKDKKEKKEKEKEEKKEEKKEEAKAEEKKEAKEEGKVEEGEKKEGEAKEEEKKEGEEDAAAAAPVTEAEQATYASSNNDLKGTLAVNNADIPGIYSLAMAIVDYRGHRVIAQSIIPGILYGDRTTQMLYGSVDTGKTIKWSDSFHPKVAELGKVLRLKEHKVTDGEGKEATLCSPVETKGILGSDDRKYLLDLIRLTPRDANFTATTTTTSTEATANAANRLAILRPELVEKFCQEEQVERWMQAKGVTERPAAEEVEALREKGELPDVVFNPNALTEFKLSDDPKEVEEDEALVRKAGKYLIETALPALVADIKSTEGWPVDGRALASTMHAHGVNLRYLGRVAKEVADVEQVYWLCVAEMVVRATKHVLKAVLRETLEQDVGGAIAHFLNCFLGTSTTTPPPTLPGIGDADKTEGGAAGGGGKKKRKNKGGAGAAGGERKEGEGGKEGEEKKEAFLYVVDVPGYTRITADMVWSDITEGVKYKYQFEIPPETRKMVRSLATLRNICLKMGIVLAAKDYNLECDVPIAIADVCDLLPQVKFASPACNDAQKLLEKGKSLVQKVGLPLRPRFSATPQSGQWLREHETTLNAAFEILSEAYQILQQVCGPLHLDVATCCRYLALIFYHAGETGNAILQQHRELIINERVVGTDHPDTVHSYGNMALYFHAMGESELALRHFKRTLQLLSLSAGNDHPEVASLFVNIALTYQDMGKLQNAMKYLQEAVRVSEKLLGENHVQVAVCHHALALAFSSMGAFKLALQEERKAQAVFEKALGKEDARTKESEQWVQSFLDRELRAQKQKAGQSAATVQQQQAAALRVAEALKQRPELLQVLQAAAAPGAGGSTSYQRAVADALLRGEVPPPAPGAGAGRFGGGLGATGSSGTGIRARGVDERASRAAAEARRKAAARGVNLRGAAGSAGGRGSGPSAMDVEELINFINSTSPASSGAGSSSAAKAGAAAGSAGGAAAVSAGGSAAPAGLGGVGLGVGVGAVSGAPPPTKAAGKKGAAAGTSKPAAAAATANGEASQGGAPLGLGGGLAPLPGGKGKGKAK